MDKEEFRVKLDEINKLVVKKNYKDAMKVVDSIDWRRVKNVRTLCVVGEIYAANQRYDDSKEIFLLAYHRAPIGKNILYRLIEISLKMGDIDEARDFYEEYKEVAPDDSVLYVLKYKILSESKAPIQKQIHALEKYKNSEFTEKWSYELAKLYYQAGEMDKCLDLCNEIIIWFNDGNYVMQAMDLKLRMGKLTGKEKERYEQNFVPKLLTPDEVEKLKDGQEGQDPEKNPDDDYRDSDEPEIGVISINNERDLGSVESIQEKISKGIRDIFGGGRKENEKSEEGDYIGDAIPKELIKVPSGEKDIVDAPNLEEEGSRGIIKNEIGMAASESSASLEEAPSDGLKISKLNIPDSMKNFEEKKSPEIQKAHLDDILSGGEGEKEESSDFNLEDTILAAASAQGIQIPEEKDEPNESLNQEENFVDDETETEEKNPSAQLEEEEFLSEEDLKAAEDEFLYGPNASLKETPKESGNIEVPPLEDEEFFGDENGEDVLEDEAAEEQEEELKDQPDYEPDDENYEEEPSEEDISGENQPRSEEEELEQFIESIQPKEERDLLDIIPREKELTEEEKVLFSYLAKVSGLKEQIVEALLDAQLSAADKTSRTGNIIVMGGRETGKTRLIAGLIPAICRERNIEASKVAYVFAEQINGLDMSRVVDKLSGGFLVIENANQLTKETVKQLGKAMEFRTDGLTVILEDEKISMRKLIARFPKFSKKFTSIINIPVFTNDELVNFARVYTKENGYRIDQMGLLALYNLIGINQKEDVPMNVGSVKDLLDAAIAKSQGGLLKLGKKKRVDRDGYKILYEKDFAK